MTKGKSVIRCTICGEALEPGSFQYCVEGQWFCEECLGEFARNYFRWALEPVE